MYTKEEVKKAVCDGLREVLKTDDVTIGEDETFENYGVDSLDQMGLLLEIEKRLKVELGEVDLSIVNTISLLHISINEKYQ